MSSSIRQMYRCFSFLVSLYRVSRFAVLPFTLTLELTLYISCADHEKVGHFTLSQVCLS